MMWFYKKKGFTLLELMIVVIIIGILAAMAVPRFITATNKAKMAEAKGLLGSIRSSQLRYYLEYENTWHIDSDLDDGSGLDLDITVSAYYTYAATDAESDADSAVARATTTTAGLDDFYITQDGSIVPY